MAKGTWSGSDVADYEYIYYIPQNEKQHTVMPPPAAQYRTRPGGSTRTDILPIPLNLKCAKHMFP